ERPAAGAIQLAEAPPEMSTRTRSSAPAESARASVSTVAARPAASGIGWPASTTRTGRVRRPEARRVAARPLVRISGTPRGSRLWRRATSAMEPAALPAARMTRRRDGGAGRCAGKQLLGCAAATAVRNSPSRTARGDAVKARTRARWNARQARKSPVVRCALGLPSSRKIAERAVACWIILRAIGARKARWKAPPAITILMAGNPKLKAPPLQAKGTAMALDDKTRTELEAAAFRRLVEHLRKRTDVQNLDLMNLAGFCRNCLSNWMKDAADA